jgi:Yeast PIR protein repeat
MHTFKSTILTIALAIAALSLPQDTATVPAVSQIGDGQVQAPTATPAIPSGPGPEIVSTPLPLVSESTPYSNPFTSYLTMTNSLGVVTGMPSVVTSQPAAVTEQPVSPTLPSYSGYAYGNSTTVGVSATATTMVTSAAESTAASSAGGSASSSAPIAQATNGAELKRMAGCGVALVVLGMGFSML